MLKDRAYSEELELEAGVPQGSILGPLLYVIFTNNLPEAVHDHLADNGSFYNTQLVCYADDSKYSTSGHSIEVLKVKIQENMTIYLDTCLKINCC